MGATQRNAFAVVGAGSWGTALAILLANNNLPTRIWGHEHEHMQQLINERVNQAFLPDINFPEQLQPVTTLEAALSGVTDVLVVVPSHAFRAVLEQIVPLIQPGMRLVWATKGLEPGSAKLLHEIAAEVLPADMPTAVLSGPTFAREVAAGLPTAITVASTDTRYAATLAELLQNKTFRVYTSDDLVGVQIGGAVKNVMAIAAGISDGLGFGANSRSALITRGLAEIMRLGIQMGGKAETFMGLAGLGDLALTCTDNQSRNRRFGMALAQGMSAELALESIGQVVEGRQTADEVHRLAERLGVDMPITSGVYRILYEGMDPHQVVSELFSREQKSECEE